MNTVQPIRDKTKIKAMKEALLRRSHRDYMLFIIGINTGLRVSDLLTLKVSEVKGKDVHIIREGKTGKVRRIHINSTIKKEIESYTADKEPHEYLFQSRKGDNKPIGRVQAYTILNNAAKAVGLDEIGSHSLRKTFGYWHYQQNKDVAVLQNILNHSTPAVTMRYIGISDDMIQQSLEAFVL